MNKTIQSRIQHPVHTAATLTAKNPVLLKGEVVYESDTRKHKIGDGATAWNALSYAGGGNFEGPVSASNITQDANHRFVSDAEKTTWNGKASTAGKRPDVGSRQKEIGCHSNARSNFIFNNDPRQYIEIKFQCKLPRRPRICFVYTRDRTNPNLVCDRQYDSGRIRSASNYRIGIEMHSGTGE